jgi:Niemann-Pick C1 protein
VPALFNPITQIIVFAITLCLLIIGFMSCKQILLGLNGNVGLVQNSDTYDYFEMLYLYGDAGPPAYLVFKNVNYTNPDNIVQMNLIAAELATLNTTVLPPVYSWTSTFQNYITSGAVWAEACGSKQAALLDFNSQMRQFVNIKIESECCQSYGVCGEQYSLDIIFDDLNRVEATRFRF